MTDHAVGPLSGMVVIDLTRALAGPLATYVLAGLGADVIKVEDPVGGDVARSNSPYLGPDGVSMVRTHEDDWSLAMLNRNRGKRSITLDLKHPQATKVFAALVASADVVVENFSAGTADRLGVGYEAAKAANPAIVYCSISGFGADSPPGVPAMDAIIQALSGVMLTSGDSEDPPIRVGVPMADALTPMFGVIGILSALHRRDREGVGAHVDVSMLGSLTSLVATEDWAALDQLGQPLRTGSTLPRLSPFGLFQCNDGHVAIVAPQDKWAHSVFEAAGRPDLITDPDFATRDARVKNHSRVVEIIETWTAKRSVQEVTDELAARNVAAAPARSPLEAVSDPRVVARGETLNVLHPELGTVHSLHTAGVPIRFADSAPVKGADQDRSDNVAFSRPAPRLGEHTDEILTGVAGIDPQQLIELRSTGALG